MRDSRFVFTWFLGLALVFQTLPVRAGDAVPVLIWDGESTGSPAKPVNPLQKTSQVEFEKIVMEKVGGSQRPVLVFVRDNLCVEDFTQHKEGLMHLKDGGMLVYLPAVVSPLSVFENLPFYNQTTEEELESVSDGQLIITKAADLDAVSETFNMVKESSPNLIAALTGRSCSYSRSERVRRAADDTSTPAPAPVEGFNVSTTRILLYASEKPTLKVSESTEAISELVDVVQEGDGTQASPLLLKFKYNIKNTTNPFTANLLLKFPEKTAGYYSTEAEYHEGDKITYLSTGGLDTSFPYNFSYHCSQNVGFVNKTIRFDIADFQVQVDANRRFGDAYDCVGFTSIPIWAGLFVTAILALIMIWGLTMIMDIRTMDRFDDPKGKTITISAAE